MMRLLILLLLSGGVLFARIPEWGFRIPGKKVSENRYVTTLELDKVLRILRRRGVDTRLRTPFNARGINGLHIQNRGKNRHWQGINIYRIKRQTHIFMIKK